MATKSGAELIVEGLVEGLRTIRRSSGYAHSPEVRRGLVDYSNVSASDKEEIYVEVAPGEPETREGDAAPSMRCHLPVLIVAVLLDEKDTTERLNAFIKDIVRCIYDREWASPSWDGGRGCVEDVVLGDIRRWAAPGTSTKAATIMAEVVYLDPRDQEA